MLMLVHGLKLRDGGYEMGNDMRWAIKTIQEVIDVSFGVR